MKPVRWGVLGVAKIALDKVIPGIRATAGSELVAIASRSGDKAAAAARRFAIPRVHASYEALLDDGGIDAIYIPLPNHLHVPWSLRALAAGKHVLCEKPIALDAAEAAPLIAARDASGRLMQEAVMVRTHPRWLGARDLVRGGRIGELRAVAGFFSYYNVAPENVRNRADIGGGGLLDIGFYPITMSRFIFEAEPVRVIGMVERDPQFGTDRLASVLMEFPRGHATFTCSTQLVPSQDLHIYGTKGHIRLDIPWSMPADRPSVLTVDDGSYLTKPQEPDRISFPACDQWQVECELFAEAIRNGAPAPVPIEDAVANMRVLDAIFRSARNGRWESPADAP